MPKIIVNFTDLFSPWAVMKRPATAAGLVIAFFSTAHGKTLSINQRGPEKITQVKISTNTLNSFQPNAVMVWTQQREKNPIKIYTTSAKEALSLRHAILTSTQVNCNLRLSDTCSDYEILDHL